MRLRARASASALSYAGAEAVLATKHGKAPLIAEPLAAVAQVILRPIEVDTDILGTFTGEVPRRAGPRETALAKARLGMRAARATIGVASEGTITPDPSVPLIAVDHELVVLLDAEHDLVVVGEATSDAWPILHRTITPDEDLERLLREADAPPHHLIVRPRKLGRGGITKAIADLDTLARAVVHASEHDPEGVVVVETDLRAHLCPARRPIIQRAAEDLAGRLMTRCPRCQAPGYGVARTLRGLPCESCGTEVAIPAAELLRCPACGHNELRTLPRITADRAECPVCNLVLP
jgi:hypothetical protein